ncbi:putative class ii aldolase family protein [Phaeoacremonium minimum UCRPA7]|uniref:Putative class ii aldolase family protein n=1 Tax=Phaeoacremonium minimum (strain UCR-PA7) TaxID=1286976 RepID=R8BDE7_PHAM7|nr:putative class ii aldolase family protein [Phaeoacremonium minimum UCRPA7]EON97314.1 putative class ii aldolase family protein [Phaeoacremonium minimum UCRPA7]
MAPSATTTETVVRDPATDPVSLKLDSGPVEDDAQDPFATGGVPYEGMPKFDDLYKKRQWQLEHMAGAFRVFARKGFTEGAAGHISVRDPVDPDTFWINPYAKHFGMLKASDMVHVDEHGQVIGGARSPVNTAGFMIHSAIHKAHPRVNAACHTHSKFGKAWSSFGKPLEILSQDACNFYQNQAVYSRFGGVVMEKEEGERIAEAMGDARCVILQNHGLLTTGSTVDEAAYLFTLAERTCEVQMRIDATGRDKIIVDDEEAAYTAKFNANPTTLYTDFQPDYEYEVWMSNGEVCK